jgi:beta-lactamase class A
MGRKSAKTVINHTQATPSSGAPEVCIFPIGDEEPYSKEKLDRFVRYGETQLLVYALVTREHVKEGGMTLVALHAAAVDQSDNTAANLLLEAIGGPEKWTEFVRSLGDKFSRLDHNEPDLNIARPGKEDDTTTPAAMCADLHGLFHVGCPIGASRIKLEGWMQQTKPA